MNQTFSESLVSDFLPSLSEFKELLLRKKTIFFSVFLTGTCLIGYFIIFSPPAYESRRVIHIGSFAADSARIDGVPIESPEILAAQIRELYGTGARNRKPGSSAYISSLEPTRDSLFVEVTSHSEPETQALMDEVTEQVLKAHERSFKAIHTSKVAALNSINAQSVLTEKELQVFDRMINGRMEHNSLLALFLLKEKIRQEDKLEELGRKKRELEFWLTLSRPTSSDVVATSSRRPLIKIILKVRDFFLGTVFSLFIALTAVFLGDRLSKQVLRPTA